MPLNFPSTGLTANVTTYTFGGNSWLWNGYAWDAITNADSVGITAYVSSITGTTNQITVSGSTGNVTVGLPDNVQIASSLSISGGTAWHVLNDGKDSGLDADLIHGVAGRRFTEGLQSGLLYGGVLSINAGLTSTFNMSAGSGIIVSLNATTGSAPDPTVTPVSWNAATGITLSGLTAQDITYVAMSSTGSIVQYSTPFTNSIYESHIPIGALIHPTRSYISFAKSYPHVAYGQSAQLDPFVRAFGPLKISGHEISGYASNLQLVRSSGTSYALGRNYTNDPNYPNIVTDTNANPVSTVYRLYRNGSGGFTTVVNSSVDATKYDDGTGTLNTVSGGLYTIQRIFFYPNEPTVLAIYYGRAYYNSIAAAKTALAFEQFSESEDTADSAVFCGYLIVKSGISNFSSTNDYTFVQGGLFRNTSNIGGGGVAVASIDDLTDVTITSATNNDLLRWNSSTSQWVNTAISNLPIAVTGANTFTGLQTMTAGITASHLWVTNGATFAARSSFNSGITANNLWVTNGATFASNISAPNVVYSFNGSTGTVTYAPPLATSSVTGVASFGNQFTVSALGAVSLTANYVSSVNGSTGAVTNVARTNVDNLFSASQTISATGGALAIADTSTLNSFELDPGATRITSYNDVTGTNTWLQFSHALADRTITLPATADTTLAGLAVTQTFTANQTFSTVANFNAGISAAGGTFSGLTRFNAGLTTSNLYVTTGATFASRSSFNAGLTTSNLFVSDGATFSGTVASNSGYQITSATINGQTGTSYSLTASDNGKIITMSNGATSTVTIIAGLPVGYNTMVIQLGTGQVGFTAASGVTMNAYASGFKISGQHGAASIVSYATNIFNVSGTLSV
jgi:hypothetical protein